MTFQWKPGAKGLKCPIEVDLSFTIISFKPIVFYSKVAKPKACAKYLENLLGFTENLDLKFKS